MDGRVRVGGVTPLCHSVLLVGLAMAGAAAGGEPNDASVAERGRVALLEKGYLKPAWSDAAYVNARRFWGPGAPDPDADPEAYAAAFARRYGLHYPAPYPNDGLPMGLRRGVGPAGTKKGLQIDCMACHGGSIGGTNLHYLGNTTLDLQSMMSDLTRADGRIMPPSLITINSSRGTVNAGMFSVILLSLRNPDMSRRLFPLNLEANIPELDTPAWWHLGRKATMYQDGRTDARSVRTNMQFLLGELSLKQFRDLEPTFRDIRSYLTSLKPPKYPFPIDNVKAERGRAVFASNCTKCHGTYGPDGSYPGKIVDLETIGTDPSRAMGISDKFVAHYNATWFGEEYKVAPDLIGYQAPPLDGVWATAPYLHNGSVPDLASLLKSSERPTRYRRPPSTSFEYYDQARVGWKAEAVETTPDPKLPVHEARFIFDSTRFGLGNGGHTFGDTLGDGERADVIEYLKSL